MNYNDEDSMNDDELYNLDSFKLPPEAEMGQYGMVLQILGPGGEIEDILFEIDDIYKYVKDVYKKCPKRN